MAGQIKKLLNTIIEKRSKGNPTIATTTRTKLIIRGLDPGNFNAASPDDPATITKVKALAAELQIEV